MRRRDMREFYNETKSAKIVIIEEILYAHMENIEQSRLIA